MTQKEIMNKRIYVNEMLFDFQFPLTFIWSKKAKYSFIFDELLLK